MLMLEKRCFQCYKVGHMKQVCRSAPAQGPPQPLKGEAPSRK